MPLILYACVSRFPLMTAQVSYDCSHEIKRCLLLERKAMTNLDSILKNRDITLPTKVHLLKASLVAYKGFPCSSVGKESACKGGDLGSIPGLGRTPGEGKGFPLQYSGLENSMDCGLPGSSVHEDSSGKNARVGCHASPRESSQPRDQTQVSPTAGGFFTG